MAWKKFIKHVSTKCEYLKKRNPNFVFTKINETSEDIQFKKTSNKNFVIRMSFLQSRILFKPERIIESS